MLGKWIANLLCLLAVAAGAWCTLMMFVGGLAGGANMKPDDARSLKRTMTVIAVAGASAAFAGIWLMTRGRPAWGAAVGLLPAIAMLVILVYFSLK